jgi:hypothetical protein
MEKGAGIPFWFMRQNAQQGAEHNSYSTQKYVLASELDASSEMRLLDGAGSGAPFAGESDQVCVVRWVREGRPV